MYITFYIFSLVKIVCFLPNITVHEFKIENDSFFFCPTNEYLDKTSFINILESI